MKRQSQWGASVICWGGWSQTWLTSLKACEHYWLVSSSGAVDAFRSLRLTDHSVTYELNIFSTLLAVFFGWLGGIFLFAALIVILALKMVPILVRAVANHALNFNLWARSPVMIVAWFAALPAIPVVVAALVPGAVVYAFYYGWQAARAVQSEGLQAGATTLAFAFKKANADSTNYILRRDVPFLTSTSRPLSLPWLCAGFLPALLALILVPIVLAGPLILNIIPSIVAAAQKLLVGMFRSSKGGRPLAFPVLALVLITLPATVPATLALLLVSTTLSTAIGALSHTLAKKSLVEGARYVCAGIYRGEYAVHKFVLATALDDPVHWASFLPRAWAFWAQPFMNPIEFPAGGGPAFPVCVVGKPAHYVPPGMRRARASETGGKPLDMCGPAYDVPGVGITRVLDGGVLAPPVAHAPTHHDASLVQIALEWALHADHSGVVRSPEALAKAYSYATLPAAYRDFLGHLAAGGDTAEDVRFAAQVEEAEAEAAAAINGLVIRKTVGGGDGDASDVTVSVSAPSPLHAANKPMTAAQLYVGDAACCLCCCMIPDDNRYSARGVGHNAVSFASPAASSGAGKSLAGSPTHPALPSDGGNGDPFPLSPPARKGFIKFRGGETLITADAISHAAFIAAHRKGSGSPNHSPSPKKPVAAAAAVGTSSSSPLRSEEAVAAAAAAAVLMPTRLQSSSSPLSSSAARSPAGPLLAAASGSATAAAAGSAAAAEALDLAAYSIALGSTAAAAAAAARANRAASTAAAMSLYDVVAASSQLSPKTEGVGGEEAQVDDGDDDDADVFVLQPVVRHDLPDSWVKVSSAV